LQWYRAEADESQTRKARKLAKALGLTRRDALGLVHLFYEAVARDFDDGNITDMTEDELREVCEFTPQGCLFEGVLDNVTCAMVNAGYIQEIKPRGKKRMIVVGWKERNGKVLRDRARKKQLREMSADAGQTVRGRSADAETYGRTDVRTLKTPPAPPQARGGKGRVSRGKKKGYVNPSEEAYLGREKTKGKGA